MPRKLKSSWIEAAEPVQLAVKQVLSCTMSLHSMSLHTHPSLHLLLKARCIFYNSIRGPVCIMSVCSTVLGEEKQRYQSKATMLLLQTPPHISGKQVLLQVFRNCMKRWIYSKSKASYIVCFVAISSCLDDSIFNSTQSMNQF